MDKLVRDRIPEIISESGDEAVVHEADDEEYFERLCDKLVEEADEFRESGGSVEELADLLEVVHAVKKHCDISDKELALEQARKAREKGVFDDRIVLDEIVEE